MSGAGWVAQFPGSTSVDDLDSTFKANVASFTAALTAAGASVDVTATYRPPERAYLMHWAWKIAKRHVSAQGVPGKEGVNINWWHGDQASSEAAANEMVSGYEITKLDVAPALDSRHCDKKAIDMGVTWSGPLTVQNADGTAATIISTPQDGTNPDLINLGAAYGVIHLTDAAKDKNHWLNGRPLTGRIRERKSEC